MNPDLQLFVREALSRGLSREAIRAQLEKAGWRPAEIDAALAAYAETDFAVPVPRRRVYLSAREAFLYLVLFATLYTTAFNVGHVAFLLIERWMPDAVRARWASEVAGLRSALAGLLIAFPVFLILSRVIGRRLAREPEARGSLVRRWLTYITLFTAALVLIGDLIALVTGVLSGELTSRFVLKVIVVFLIAGIVFVHYLTGLRAEESERGDTGGPRWLARAGGAAVLVVIAIGLFQLGSPAGERLRQLDRQRVAHLRGIVQAIDQFYLEEKRLPRSIDELLDRPDGISPVTVEDPTTRLPYEYRAVDSLAYELCATFERVDSLPSADGFDSERTARFWRHGAGRTCFALRARPPAVAPLR